MRSKLLIWTQFPIKLQRLQVTRKSVKTQWGKKYLWDQIYKPTWKSCRWKWSLDNYWNLCMYFTVVALTYNWNASFIITNSILFYCSKRRNKLTSCLVHVLHTGSYHRSVVFTHLNQSAKHKKASVTESCLSFRLMPVIHLSLASFSAAADVPSTWVNLVGVSKAACRGRMYAGGAV